MRKILFKTFVTLALLLSISEVASGGTVRISTLLNGAVTTATLGEVSQQQTDATCIISVVPASAYSVESVTAIKVTDGGNAQSRRNAPAINVPLEVEPGDAENTWTFSMPTEEYDVEVTVNFTFRMFGLAIQGIPVTGSNMADIMGNGTVSFVSETNTLTLANAAIVSEADTAAVEYVGDADLTIMIVGNDTLQSADGTAAIRCYGITAAPKLIFTTSDEAPGQLISTGNALLLEGQENVEYKNGLAFSYVIGGQMIGCFETYPLWVNGIQATAMNKGNVFCDENKTVRFDDATNTLTLRKAVFTAGEGVIPVKSMLGNLTVNLLEANYIVGNSSCIFQNRGQADMPTLTFITTDRENPGKLEFEGETLQAGFNEEVVFENALAYNAEQRLISVVPKSYGLTVAGTEVTNVNFDDVLGNGTVKYNHANGILTLNKAVLAGDIVLSEASTLATLTVMLADSTTTTAKFISLKADAYLVFATNPNAPGSLTFIGKSSAEDIQSGFTYDENSLQNGLLQAAVNDNLDWQISTFFPIAPIVNEDNTEEIVTINALEYDIELENQAINNVLYTLPSTEGDVATNQGYDYDTDNRPGIIVSSGMTDDEVDNAVSNTTVGTAEFAEAFHGITLETPAGIGTVSFTVRLLNANAKVRVKMGDGEAYTPEGLTTEDYTTVVIPYNVTEPTFIYIYLLDDTANGSRIMGPHRGKVLGTTVKVSGYSGSCQASVSNGMASVYSFSASGATYNPATGTLKMSRISIGVSSSAVVRSRTIGGPLREAVSYPIATLGPNFFNDFTGNLETLKYIDLTGTSIEGMTVNRSLGTFNGIGEHTVICLPENNDDGNEANAVIGGNCQKLLLDSQYDFRLPEMTFTAENVELLNVFTPEVAGTLLLPFTIPSDQATALGSFYNFKETKDSETVVFNTAETGDIEANKPYLFVPAASEFTVSDVDVSGIDSTRVANGLFYGTFERISWDSGQTDIYVYEPSASGIVDEGHFVRAAAGTSLQPFRAYLNVSGNSSMNVVIDSGESTGIETVGNAPGQSSWYTLNGQKLHAKPTRHGLYTSNGRKVNIR